MNLASDLRSRLRQDPAVQRRKRTARGAKQARPETVSEKLLDVYENFCYALLGARLDRRRRTRLGDTLKQAGVHLSPGLYLSMAIVSAGFAALLLTPLASIHFALVVGTPLWPLLGPGLGLASAALVGGAFPAVVKTRIAKRRERIEKEIPFSLGELSVLAAIGLSPINMMAKMAERDEDPAMTSEFRKVVFKTRIQGKDLITALAETARESPSKLLRETLWDLGNMIHQGSNLAQYLDARSSEVLEAKRSKQTQFIDTLGTFGDMYVTGVLLSVIFLGMGAFLIDALGTGAGLTGTFLLSALAYFLIPTIVVVVAILLSTAHARVD